MNQNKMAKKPAKTHIALYCVVYFYSPFAWILSHTLRFLLLSPSYTIILFLSNSLTLWILSLLFLFTLTSLRLSFWTICMHTLYVSSFAHTWSLHNFIGCECVCVCDFFPLPFGAIKCGVCLTIQLWYLSDEWILKDWLLRVVFLPLCQLSAISFARFHHT